jgi:cyclopropane fatty-acyl-phospholipid synthase-like methyltransferase
MEKIKLGLQMATRWSDPTAVLIFMVGGTLIAGLGSIAATSYGIYQYQQNDKNLEQVLELFTKCPALLIPFIIPLVMYMSWCIYHSGDTGVETEKYVVFNDESTRATYKNRRIPIAALVDLYVNGKLNFNPECEGGDCWKVLEFHRNEFVNYKITGSQLWWLIEQLFPFKGGHGQGNSSQKDIESTTKEIAEHYDRGNAFFNAFLGPSMVYTSGVFKGLHQSLEQAQANKMDFICQKLQLKKDERFLDIGCGWGTLTRHAVHNYGAKGTGVTLSKEGKKWCDEKSEEEKVPTEILKMDYRDIPRNRKFDKIASIEMAEHVGLANFVDPYLSGVRRLMTDDGLFLMQVAGLRQGSNWQDVAWGLFMSKYIFPGADASAPLNWYVRQLELAGFEVHSVENIGRHYSHTLHKWYDNWMSNKDDILSGKIDCENGDLRGERMFRMWEFFLAWSVIASGQCSATCYQLLAHPNVYDYPRDRWVDPRQVSSNRVVGVGINQ